MLRYLTKEQRDMVRKIGRALFHQKNPGAETSHRQEQPGGAEAQPPPGPDTPNDPAAPKSSRAAETAAPASSCIVVATDRPMSPLKRRRHNEPESDL